ncbi:MAG: hypothetical protein JXB34_03180 [Bacteroidales bacterium]|nr:hypothetical protein [Bacteroidales bacterium]
MKKTALFLILSFIAISMAFSQESTFNKGDKVVNLGIGLGAIGYGGTYWSTTFPPISVSGEMGFMDGVLDKGVIGIGGIIGYSAYKWEYTYPGYDNYGWKYTNFILGARGSFHYPLVDKLDTYTGLALGARIQTETEFGTLGTGYVGSNAAGSGPFFSWFAGARYYFNDKFAGMAEIGYGISYLTLGLSVKL